MFELKNTFDYYPLENIRIRKELVKTILERWNDGWEKDDCSIRYSYNNIKKLMEKIISLYPDIFRECFDDLTETHKCMLIASALSTSHLRTTIKIKQYIKENIQDIILFVKCFDRMGSTDEAIENGIDEALGLNPLITHYHKKQCSVC